MLQHVSAVFSGHYQAVLRRHIKVVYFREIKEERGGLFQNTFSLHAFVMVPYNRRIIRLKHVAKYNDYIIFRVLCYSDRMLGNYL